MLYRKETIYLKLKKPIQSYERLFNKWQHASFVSPGVKISIKDSAERVAHEAGLVRLNSYSYQGEDKFCSYYVYLSDLTSDNVEIVFSKNGYTKQTETLSEYIKQQLEKKYQVTIHMTKYEKLYEKTTGAGGTQLGCMGTKTYPGEELILTSLDYQNGVPYAKIYFKEKSKANENINISLWIKIDSLSIFNCYEVEKTPMF